jgi:hypothetical protein
MSISSPIGQKPDTAAAAGTGTLDPNSSSRRRGASSLDW